MENNYYLSIGTKLGGHYEIEKVLSEDEFEILYLAKDLHKRGEYVVLKELFLKTYSSRDGADVSTVAKSKIIFEETKKEIKKEVDGLLENPSSNQVSIYGTFEENNTIYTIMEFVNNSNLDGYLKVNTTDNTPAVSKKDVMQEEIIEPSTKKTLPRKEEKKEKSSIFLKILITMLLICLALGYYAYNMIKDDKTKTKEKTTSTMTSTMVKEEPKQERTTLPIPISKENLINDYKEESQNKEENKKERTTKIIPKGAAYVTDVDAFKKEQEIKRAKEEAEKKAFEEKEEKLREREEALLKKEEKLREDEENALEDEEERLREEEEKKLQEEARKEAAQKDESKKNEQNSKEFVPDNIGEFIGEDDEPSNHPENDVPSPFKDAEENLPLGAVKPNALGKKIASNERANNSLGSKIGDKESKKEKAPTANKQAIKQFLNNFIQISGDGSIDEILSNYDDDVERYFSLRNVNHDTIRRDKTNYHRKWSHRKFKLLNFDVTKVYKNGDATLYDIKTTTNWSVSNDEGKSIAGTSNGVMTLRKTDDGFKVTSIYTNKSK